MKKNNQEFHRYYNFLISLSYRYLGSFSEAEEIVQEVAIEWLNSNQEEINNPKAWLIRVCTNKSLDALKKAYKKREVYTGTWIPEVLPDSLITWNDHLENQDSLKTSFLILLENLNPKERTVYVLRIVFDYSFKEISEFIELTESNCRKVYQRAKEKIDSKYVKFDSLPKNGYKNLEKLFEYAREGSSEKIANLLHSDSEFWSDGGGKVSATRQIFHDNKKIAHFFATIFHNLSNDKYEYKYEFTKVNSQAGLILSRLDEKGLWKLETIFSFEFINGKIARIFAQRNPDKLMFLKRFI